MNESDCKKSYKSEGEPPLSPNLMLSPLMKRLMRRPLFSCFCLVLPLMLSGCGEQAGQLNALQERLDASREANAEGTLALQQLNLKLATANRQISEQSAKRLEFEAKSAKSAATEQLLAKYQVELEGKVKAFAESVAAYRQQHLKP